MKNIQLSAEEARELLGINSNLDRILKENFTNGELGLKELPLSYEEVKDKSGYIMDFNRNLIKTDGNLPVAKTKEQALSIDAYQQLTQLMYEYNEGWEPDWWNRDELKYVIERENDDIEISCYYNSHNFLAFPTEEIAIEFLFNFKDLIKMYYQI